MAEVLPPASMLRTLVECEDWETQFVRYYVSPLVRKFTETVTSFRAELVTMVANQGNYANTIESEVDQTSVIDNEYRLSKLPQLWRKIDYINFSSFLAYYDLAKYQTKYPFLEIFIKHSEQLEIIKNLWPIVQFIKILSSRLSYRISRKDAEIITFDQFIYKEVDKADLNKMFKRFEKSWNAIIDKVYQCHKLGEKQRMSRNMPIVLGLVEVNDFGIYLCAILEYLIGIQNNFLLDVMNIPPDSCKALRFLEKETSTATLITPSQYSIRSLALNQARIDNIIMYDREELGGIHMFSQRNLGIGCGLDVIYDLQRIEVELARQLLFEKVYIDTVDETSLYLPPFSYHMELIQLSPHILGDITDLIPQEKIPTTNLPHVCQPSNMDKSLDNLSEILSSLEILLSFIKRTPGGNGESFIKDYVNQWLKLSGLIENHEFHDLLNRPLKLKHIVSLYELIEGQVANLTIEYIHVKYKEGITPQQEDEIENLIDFESNKPAIIANEKSVTDPLFLYICDPSLHFWPPAISELEYLDESFPDSLFVNQAFEAYKFVMDLIWFDKLYKNNHKNNNQDGNGYQRKSSKEKPKR
ncbi:e3 ubiquitin-protein ligase [Gigaspora margarita]|uniref:E3 ubiquitin-protein ligase n=1 Tax=Gigaspora margarita TaxID=4874 RepID=A0A8H3X666_GIGMA|nr:e3 ubiquitin-protein ligase [Gigaspora margarita]